MVPFTPQFDRANLVSYAKSASYSTRYVRAVHGTPSVCLIRTALTIKLGARVRTRYNSIEERIRFRNKIVSL